MQQLVLKGEWVVKNKYINSCYDEALLQKGSSIINKETFGNIGLVISLQPVPLDWVLLTVLKIQY
jgi:hypothetical protein